MSSQDRSRSGSTSSRRSSSLQSLLTKIAPRPRSSVTSASSTNVSGASTSSLHLPRRPSVSSTRNAPEETTFAPMRDVSPKEQHEAPNLGDNGWGQRDWSKIKAEQDWIDEQKAEYAKQKVAYTKVHEEKIKRGDGGIVRWDVKWDEQLNKTKAAEEKKRKEEEEKARLVEEERRKKEEQELQWKLHPPTPMPWPGQDESDSDCDV
ncbi:unnamed protein product [Periconia digitata]|uniref:Uncharacterized protein n=1 Tax=Periconia digitata TaxID=1303443 RepID=A0A9W4U4G5_9PLEO|nr:unnamed protein product [Periconia digitata]